MSGYRLPSQIGALELVEHHLQSLANEHYSKEEFSTFTFTDERDSDKEVIDVIRNHVRFSKRIELSAEERKIPAAIWRKLCGTLG